MVLFVKVLGVAIIVYGCLIVLRPSILKKVIEYARKGNRIYWTCGIKIAVGVLLLIAASSCSISWLVLLFGALSILGPVVFLLLKKKAVTEYLDWIDSRPAKFVYGMGVFALAMGVLLVLAA